MNELDAVISKIHALEREIERLKRVETPRGVSMTQTSIHDDGAINFTPRNSTGILLVRLASHYAIISFDTSPVPVCIKMVASAFIDTATVQLKGLQGTDGRITISAFGGKLYIENRIGQTLSGGYLAL